MVRIQQAHAEGRTANEIKAQDTKHTYMYEHANMQGERYTHVFKTKVMRKTIMIVTPLCTLRFSSPACAPVHVHLGVHIQVPGTKNLVTSKPNTHTTCDTNGYK